MPYSPVDLYRDILPKTNCGECGYRTCLAFASMVVSEQLPVAKCPYVDAATAKKVQQELDKQHAAGKWVKRDMAKDALVWARERTASMKIEDLPERIGGELIDLDGKPALRLPYFSGHILITDTGLLLEKNRSELNRWEQVFIYNHLAQGGSADPTENWRALEQIPNTISKTKSMRAHVEAPLVERFNGKVDELRRCAVLLGAEDRTEQEGNADAVLLFRPLPKIPVMLRFWNAEPDEGFEARAHLLFDETITEHLDVESIMFLSERIRELLCDTADGQPLPF